MRKLYAFYFSGTGNTRYVAKKICKRLSAHCETQLFDITGGGELAEKLKEADAVLLAFPIYGSSPPIPMREFVFRHAALFRGKPVFLAETQYFFSGDGAASMGRALEKMGAKVIAAEHFNMPNNLSDCKIFAVKNGDALKKTLKKTDRRIERFAETILNEKRARRGFHTLPHAVGYFCQRKYWRKGETAKRKRLKVDAARCVGCRMCEKNCPVSNISVRAGKAVPLGKCVMCYRCVNLCPRKAISLIGSAPPEVQYKGV